MAREPRQQRGIDFEAHVAEALGLRQVPGSGSNWRSKGDCKGRLRISCKAEATKTWGRIREQLREAIDMAFGTGELPALAVLEDDGEELVVMRLSDLAKALESGGNRNGAGPISRGEMTRDLAGTPAMLRSD